MERAVDAPPIGLSLLSICNPVQSRCERVGARSAPASAGLVRRSPTGYGARLVVTLNPALSSVVPNTYFAKSADLPKRFISSPSPDRAPCMQKGSSAPSRAWAPCT